MQTFNSSKFFFGIGTFPKPFLLFLSVFGEISQTMFGEKLKSVLIKVSKTKQPIVHHCSKKI